VTRTGDNGMAFQGPCAPGGGPGDSGEAALPSGLFRSAALSQAMGVYLPATVALRLINLGRILLLTWWMARQQFGLLTMILLTMNVMVPLCSVGLHEAVARYVPQHETRGSLVRFIQGSAGLLVVVALVSVVVMIVLARPLGVFLYAQVFTDSHAGASFAADAPQLARLTAVVIGVLIAYFYLLSLLKGLRMFYALSVVELTHAVLFLAGAVAAWWTEHLSALTLTGVYGVSMTIPIVIFGWRLLRVIGRWRQQHGASHDAHLARTLLRFSIWTTLAGVTWQILVAYPAWFLNKVHGNEAVAVFNAVRQVGQFVLIGAVAVSTVVMTTVTKTWESRGREAAIRQLSLAFRGTGLALLVGCASVALAKGLVIRLFSPEYAAGAAILPLQLLFFLIGAYLAFLPIHFHLIEKTRHMFWPWAVGVAANVLYAFWLAGPRLAELRDLEAWKAAAPVLGCVFAPGFSDPQGLDSAAWCGVLAIGTALVLCAALIRAECGGLDRGTGVMLVAAVLLAMKPWILAVGVLLLIVLAFRTEHVFSAEERRRIVGYVVDSLRQTPGLRWLGRRKEASG